MAQTDQATDDSKADMTPMIDVVFLMIIFFICIEFKVLESKLDAFLPTDKGSSPTITRPVEQLSVRVEVVEPGTPIYPAGTRSGSLEPGTGRPPRYVLSGHRVRWQIGPKSCADMAACESELMRIAADPRSHVPDPLTGGKKLMSCVVEGQLGTRYDDIARTADLCRAAGFAEIHFGGGMGAIADGK